MMSRRLKHIGIGGIVACLAAILAVAVDCPTNYVMSQSITFARNHTPYFATNWPSVEWGNLDLSLDSGTNWHRRIAHGLPLAYGTNEYSFSVRVTPDLWTEHARIAVRTLWSSTTNAMVDREGAISQTDFTIAGIRLLAPTNNSVLLQPGYCRIVWHEAGPDYVDIGISTNRSSGFTPVATVESQLATNEYWIPIEGMTTGRWSICVVAYSNLYDIVDVEVRNR